MGRTSPHTVSGLESHLGFWLRFVSNHVSQAFARKLLATGITVAEWVMLREMFDGEGFAPSELAEKTGLTRGAVSKLLDRLIAKKLVERKFSSEDRRFQRVELTAAGRKIVPKLAALADRNDEEFFAALHRNERDELRGLLVKLVQAHGLSKVPME